MEGKTYRWKTEKGGQQVELVISEGYVDDTIYADGWNVETKRFERKVVRFSIDGQEHGEATLGSYGARRAVLFEIGGRRAVLLIPEAIEQKIFAREIAQARKRAELEKEYADGYNRVARAMRE